MNPQPATYRIEIRHTTHIDKIPVEQLDAAIAEWRGRPWWQRLLRRSPLVRIGSQVLFESEELPERFDQLDDAAHAARRHAEAAGEVLRPDTTIVVVRSDGHEMGGWYPGDRGPC